MKIEKQIVSLELAKKLKELGVKQESYFYWEKWIGEREGYSLLHYKFVDTMHPNDKARMFSAFTVAELGEMLIVGTGIRKIKKGYSAYYHHGNSPLFHDKSEADARAKMLIYLIENKLQTIGNK